MTQQPSGDSLNRLFEISLVRDTILGNFKNVFCLDEVQAVVGLHAIGALQTEDLRIHFENGIAKFRDDPFLKYRIQREILIIENEGVGDAMRPDYVPEQVYDVAKKGLAARKALQSCKDVTREGGSASKYMYTYFIYACAAGLGVDEVEKLSRLVDKDLKHDHVSMTVAAGYGHCEIVNWLFFRKRMYDTDNNALFAAVANGQVDVVRFLNKEHMYSMEAMNCDEMTALMIAAQSGHAEIAQMLLENNDIEVDFQGDWCEEYDPGECMTALMHAACNGHWEVVKVLLESGKVNVELKDQYSRSALMYAAIGGNAQVFDALFSLGELDINERDFDGNTALIYACEDGFTEIVRLMLESGKVDINLARQASWNRPDISQGFCYGDAGYGRAEEEYRLGQTPIMFAATNGHLDVVKLLFDTDGIDLNWRDKHGMSLLAHGVTSSHANVAEFLINSGKFDLNAVDVTGNTPLMHASQWGLGRVVKALLETGKVDVNLKSPCGRTALAYALEYENEQAFKVLLEAENIDVNSKDSEGKSILIRASMMGKVEMVRILLQSGKANIHAEDFSQKNALMYAIENGYPEIVSLLEHEMSSG